MSSLKDKALAWLRKAAHKDEPPILQLIDTLDKHIDALIAERDELAQQRGDLAAKVLELQEAAGLLARLHLATGCVPQGTLSDGEFAFLRGAWMRAGNYLRLLPEDARPGTVASDSQPSEMSKC